MNQEHRRAVIAGNWKMNKTNRETRAFFEALQPLLCNTGCDIVVCTPFTDLQTAVECTRGTEIAVGAQNCHYENAGAFTGEISPEMLREIGVQYVIIGHSERRRDCGETDATVNKRLRAALAAGLTVIVCIGESADHQQRGVAKEVCALQVKAALDGVAKQDIARVIIAYEPIWAIGTGVPVAPEQANTIAADIRREIAEKYDSAAAQQIRILYGGSMKASNAAGFFRMDQIDGGLIGGAALDPTEFSKIING